MDFLRTHLETLPSEAADVFDQTRETPSTPQRNCKHQLSTTITPDRRVSYVKTPRSSKAASKKLLADEIDEQNKNKDEVDVVLNLLNIDRFDVQQEKKESQVKVIISYLNGDIKTKEKFKQTMTLIWNIALKMVCSSKRYSQPF